VEIDHDNAAVRIRREMEAMFSSKTKSEAA
jgi:hypothetical protein